jgi:uncharacterized membrane protein
MDRPLESAFGAKMEKQDNESGQVMILTALCMTVLLGFLALAVDVALLFRARRNVQITADAAAIGALPKAIRRPGSACRSARIRCC